MAKDGETYPSFYPKPLGDIFRWLMLIKKTNVNNLYFNIYLKTMNPQI